METKKQETNNIISESIKTVKTRNFWLGVIAGTSMCGVVVAILWVSSWVIFSLPIKP